MKFAQIVVVFVVILVAMGHEISRPKNRLTKAFDEEKKITNYVETRKHKLYHDLFLFMGGLQSLVTFVVIKIKIVLVVVTLIGFIALSFKLLGLLKYTGYFYKNDYPSIGPPEYSSYPGPPLTGYASSHHEHEVYSNDWAPHPESYSRSRRNLKKFGVTRRNSTKFENEDCITYYKKCVGPNATYMNHGRKTRDLRRQSPTNYL
ncbi:uncharacterized protein [Venturia canescens]|uniref:uncharacterized protein n=1 Tax=Venturia canescens TaxID=32260 RepID=UPI001C9BFFC2|nr:uncharacterized protein LOC122410878 [Venturia canescens]